MYVYETQETFRKLVETMSYVGEIYRLPELKSNTSVIPDSEYLLAAALLDQEVSFSTMGFSEEEQLFISQEFRSRSERLEEAEYIFLRLNKLVHGDAEQLVALKVGTLINPQDSATVFGFCSSLINSTTTHSYEIQGPGIPDRKLIGFPEECRLLITLRNDLNQEYPLGIDIIFVDNEANIVSIPRTTKIREVK